MKVSTSKKDVKLPRGKPKSGRVWKNEKKKFSSTIKTKGLKSSYEQRKSLRKKVEFAKQASQAIKDAKEEEKKLKKERRRQNLKRQEENRKKSEVVQVIKNTSKIKKMKRKQLRQIEKRDTNNLQAK